MLNQHHPDDERLSGLASHDDDATADTALTAHVDSCARCADLVTELGALRASLADLPDLVPHRPLQLVPPVADSPTTSGAAGWIRRVFAPALTAGAALAMVGVIGTAAPALDGMGAGGSLFQNVGTELGGEPEPAAGEAVDVPAAESTDDVQSGVPGGGDRGSDGDVEGYSAEDGDRMAPLESEEDGLPAERSPWPMVLFTGVAVMVAAALLRWILVPRAG